MACSDLGVFELVPETGEASLKELADKTGADQQLLCQCPERRASCGIEADTAERSLYEDAHSNRNFQRGKRGSILTQPPVARLCWAGQTFPQAHVSELPPVRTPSNTEGN